MQSRSLSVLASVGALLVAVGTYLPWITVNPQLPPDEPVPAVYFPGMDSGVSGVDYVLLALAGLVLLAHLTGSREPRRSGLTLVAGVGSTLACVGYLLYPADFGFLATFVPALGWYVTFVGGVVLAVAGGVGVLGFAALGPR